MPEAVLSSSQANVLVDGIHIPLTAPFYRDGRSYLRKLEHNVGRYSLTPAAGLVALCPGSEGTALSDEEIRETLAVVGATAAPEKVLIAAIARDSVRGTLEIAEQAALAGFDAVLLGAPPLWPQLVRGISDGDGQDRIEQDRIEQDRIEQDRIEQVPPELMVYFRAVADGSPLPVLLSSDGGGNEKRGGGYALPVGSVGELSSHPNIIGLYDADLSAERYRALLAATLQVQREVTVTTVFAPVTRRMQVPAFAGGGTAAGGGAAGPGFVSAESLATGTATAAAVAAPPASALPPALAPQPGLKTRTRKVGFQIMAAGRASGLVALLEAGVAGALPTLAACAPQGCYEAYAAFKDGDPALAREKEERLLAADALLGRLGVAALKYGCDLNGYYGGVPRLPRLPPDAAARSLVELVLAAIRN